MALSNELISLFAKTTNNTSEVKKETTVYGTTVEYNGKIYVKIDGSDLLTPASSTVSTKPGERVVVNVKNHSAMITGNVTSPSASTAEVNDLKEVVADKVSTSELNAEKARIDELIAENITVKEKITANEANISELLADKVIINKTLTAVAADIEDLNANKLSATTADLKYATIENLDATNAVVYNLKSTYADFEVATVNRLNAVEASIEDLDADKLSATDADLKYANIDFSNIGKTAMEYFYAESGLIKNVVVGDQTITGDLVGVTISGDLIEGNTIVADKLVIKGEDGLYYRLNTDGVTTEIEQTDYNSLNGSVIRAKSVTADKISVSDLVAFDATIGGYHITDDAIYSGVKESVSNTTRGVYMDNDGQFAVGDADNFIKYYKDTSGKYRLSISAESLEFTTTGKNVEETISDIQGDVDKLRDEITTMLYIESSEGNVFKNDSMSTILSVVLYHGTERITDSNALETTFGPDAYLQWKLKRDNEDEYTAIPEDDGRIDNGGFTFVITPNDVDAKAIFICELIT